MNRIAVSAVGSALVLVLSGAALCAGDAATTPVAAVAGASPSSPPTATTATAQATLTDALDALLAGSPAALSVAVHDERTGATLRYAAGRRYQTASVVKVDILATLLWQARGQDRDLTADERSLARRMITASDNAAATALWRDIGGDPALTGANAVFGLSATTVGTDGYWGVTETTAGDQLTLLRTVLDPDGPLGAARSACLAGLMADVVDGQDWDVGAAGRGGESVVLKNGWDIEGDVWNVNSVGRIGDDVTLAVLSTGSATQADGVALVERAARLARTALPAG